MRTAFGVVVSLAIAGAAPAAAQDSAAATTKPSAQGTDSVSRASPGDAAPAGDAALIARGDKVFHGPGNCYACHGSNATGLVGPNLTDAEWIHSKGTYDDIVAQIKSGVPKEQSKSGIAMPPLGGGTLSDEDVKAVAAYVYSLRQK